MGSTKQVIDINEGQFIVRVGEEAVSGIWVKAFGVERCKIDVWFVLVFNGVNRRTVKL